MIQKTLLTEKVSGARITILPLILSTGGESVHRGETLTNLCVQQYKFAHPLRMYVFAIPP
jgi:hypothetical protein